MSYCDACGTPRREGQRFCTGCGKSLEDGGGEVRSPYAEPTPAGPEEATPTPAPTFPASGQPTAEFPAPAGGAAGAPPGAPPPRGAGVAMPSWLVTDWPVVGICVLLIAFATLVVSAVYGAVVALAASGGDAVVSGAITGAYLAFSAFGAASGAFRATEDSIVQVATSFLPLPWVLVPVIAAWVALGFGYPRVATQRAARLAFVAKVAVVFGVLAGIMASVLSLGEFESESGSGDLVSRVSAGSVAFYAMLILGLTGLVYLVRRGDLRSLNTRLSQLAARTAVLMEGAKAFALVVVVMAAVALVAALVVADSMTERLVVLLAIPFLVVNVGIAGAALAMGGSVGLGEAPPEDSEFVTGVITDHVSLLHWGFPPGGDPGSAPPYLYVLLALAPAAAGWMAYRWLQRRPASTEQDLWSVGFLVALGFALASFVGALFGRILLSAFTDDFERGGILFARPSVAAALGLGLLWGIVGGLGGALLWGRRQGMTVISRAGPTGEASPGAPPVASESTVCPRCGSPVGAGARFCDTCGNALT